MRTRAGGDENVLCGNGLPTRKLQIVRAGKRSALVEDLDVMIFERIGIDPVEPVDIAQHHVAQRNPVERRLLYMPSELLGVLEVLGKVRTVDEHFLGHAATDHAGAADPELLRHGDPGAMSGRDPAGAHSARSGADGEQVVVVFGHLLLLWRQSCRDH